MAALTAVQSGSPSEELPQVATLALSPRPHDEPATGAVASRRESKQPTATELAKYGIKVRDFAFESTLPPIAPVYLHPKQIQPNPGVLRPCQDNMQAQSSSQGGDGRKLETHPTQSLIQPFGVTRQRGFVDLRDYETDNDELPESQDSSIYTLSQPPVSYSQSQDSEEYVKTPIITPNGSLQWQDVDGCDLPASQLDNVLPLQPLSLSQTPTQTETVHAPMSLSPLSSLSSANSSFCISPSPMPVPKTLMSKYRLRKRPSHTIKTRPSPLTKDQTPPIPTSPASRYYLRKRPNPTSPSTSRPATRSRLGLSALSPLSKSKQSVAPSTPPSRRQEKASEDAPLRIFRKRTTPAVKTSGKL